MLSLQGSIVALVTPFRDGAVDYEKLRELVDFHLQSGTQGISPIGTTGEAPTLTHEEKKKIIRTVVEAAKRRVPVIPGTGSYDTRVVVEQTRMAKELGADAALVVTPYYNKPTQEGLYRHYEAVATQVDLPLVLYNVPGRTAVNLLPDTVARLTRFKNIVAIKEASGDLIQVSQIREKCAITILSGEDALTYAIMERGGQGVISVAANVIPEEMSQLCSAMRSGNVQEGQKIHQKLEALFKALFIETNPIPVKTAMGLMGLIANELRLPLCEMNPQNAMKLKSVLESYSLV